MRRSIAGLGAVLLAAGILTACGNEPEPLGPAGSNFEDTREPVGEEPTVPVTPAPEMPSDPLMEPGLPGSEPGEIPEIMEEQPPPNSEPGTETTFDDLEYPETPTDDPDETGAPL